MISLRRAYVWSFLAHAVLAVMLSRAHVKAEAKRVDTALRSRAAEHAPVYRQKSAEMQAEQIRRMRELIEKLAAKEKTENSAASPKRDPGAQESVTEAAAPASAAPKPQEDPSALNPKDDKKPKPPATPLETWRRAQEEYTTARDRFLDQRAERLADLRKIDFETARRMVEQQQGQGPGSGGSPQSDREASEQIGQMHTEAQRMLNESRRLSREKSDGQQVDASAGLEAFWLTQTQTEGRESRAFDESVDWTELMRNGDGSGAVNGRIDSPDDLRRVNPGDAAWLKARLQKTAKQVAFTRRIGGDASAAAAWICPDVWYIIGPFPNPRREAIDRTYPPDLEIDRDAVYEGLDGKPVSWIYTKPQRHIVIPPNVVEYGIYYGFTEIFCAQEIDCWLALGSDDHSKLWINDLLVWSSSKNLKTRDTAEGFRKVHLAKGVNRFLFRLENGWNGAEFSLLIALE